jgi:hypothetical protein
MTLVKDDGCRVSTLEALLRPQPSPTLAPFPEKYLLTVFCVARNVACDWLEVGQAPGTEGFVGKVNLLNARCFDVFESIRSSNNS